MPNSRPERIEDFTETGTVAHQTLGERAVQHFIEGTDTGEEILNTVYPPHIYDPVRRAIATEIMGKEIAKLVGAEGNGELERLRGKVDEWFGGIDVVQSPVHDFWSTFELLPLVKTKRLSRFVTAGNVDWHQEVRDIDALTLTWMPFIESHLDVFGPGPWPIAHLKSVFAVQSAIYAAAQASNSANIAHYRFEHSDEPVTLVQKPGAEFFLDGNGRLYRALMAGKQQVNCWVGYMDDEQPRDYWVSTGLLKNLCYDIIDNETTDPEASAAALTLLRKQLADNEVARTNYDLWIRKHFPQLEDRLALAN